MKAVYVGPIAHLRGEQALVQHKMPDRILAQFDNTRAFRRSYRQHQMRPRGLRKHLGFRWHSFPASDWKLIQREQ